MYKKPNQALKPIAARWAAPAQLFVSNINNRKVDL